MSGFFSKLKKSLFKTTSALGLKKVFTQKKIDEEFLEDLEDRLLSADLGPTFVLDLVQELEQKNSAGDFKESSEALLWLKGKLVQALELTKEMPPRPQAQPAIWFFLGVNGVGKTTSLGKLACRLQGNGFKVVMAAADTFRAGAGEQLARWSERAGARVVRHREGGDPSAVIFDAYDAAIKDGADYLLIDTAGRLHNKKNLMAECEKMLRVLSSKGAPEPEEIFIVVDATTGQNAIQQAKLFSEIAPVSGLILTKLDGSAKGGVVFPLVKESGIPIRYIGTGEGIEDLDEFKADEFIRAFLPEDTPES